MKFELPVGQEALLSERGRLESLLAASEDWRALLQLRSRQERGEGLSAVNAARLEALLIDALAENPFYGHYTSVCAALGGPPAGRAKETDKRAEPEQAVDDLTRIRGIDGETARRLRALGVWTYGQVAEWTSMDIHRVSTELGIGKLIHSQNWIEQAALLALANPREPVKTSSPSKNGALSQPGGQQFVQPVTLPKQEPLPVPPVAARAALIQAVTREASTPPAPPQPAPQPIRAVEPVKETAKPIEAPVQAVAAPSAPAPVVVAAPPPAPLRVATVAPPPVAAPVAEKVVPPAPPVVAIVEPYPLRDPPRPYVITRSTLAAAPPTPPPVTTPAEPVAAKPEPIVIPPLPPTPLRVDRPAAPVAAPGTVPASAAPAMTITEAIAYAAAAARSTQRTAPDVPPVGSGAANGAHKPAPAPAPEPVKAVAEPPPLPSVIRVPGPPPNIPPPLPADFQPPEPKAEQSAPIARPVKFDTPRALTIDRDREDIGGFNAHVEEAIVEIVRKPSASAPVPPKAALAAAVAAAQAAQPPEGSRNATPIGRFLKALTGN
jgi:predicted flap endonuclease-1-like 5' DNA nuclease